MEDQFLQYIGSRVRGSNPMHRVPQVEVREFTRWHIISSELLKLHLDIAEYSPTGFEWGYRGSGPAQLSLAILYDYFGDAERALENCHAFKEDIISRLPREFNLSGEQIERWYYRGSR